MAIHRVFVKIGQKPTEKQRKRLRKAAALPITYDDDSPELTTQK